MSATIRTATAADVDAVTALVQRAYRGDDARAGWTHEADLLDGQRVDRDSIAALVEDARAALLVVEDSAITGCVEVRDKGGGRCSLGMLSVDPVRQAGGLGRALIAAAEDAARARGADTMEMTVISQRAELIAYYARRGYALTAEERPFPQDVRFGVPKVALKFVVLVKRLRAG